MATETVSKTELHIGNRVAVARQILGISQESLAIRLRVLPEWVQQYEEGKGLTSPGQLYDIARALEVDVSFFYEGLAGATSCPFSLTADRYALLRRAVQRIASDHATTASGARKRLPRHEAINIAREVCDALGWDYGNRRPWRAAHPVMKQQG